MGRFLLSQDDAAKSRIIMYGAPLDVTTSYRPGTRFGPRRVREVSEALESYSPILRRDLEDIRFYDGQDLPLALEAGLLAALEGLERKVYEVYASGRKVLVLGGEHLITLPVVRAVHRHHPGLVVLWLDAHADLRERFGGSRLSHATVARRVLETVGETHLIQLGVRSACREEAGSLPNGQPGLVEAMRKLRPTLEGRPIYLSLDIDVLDPAYAPGTGAPEPGGMGSRELLEAVYLLDGLDLVGADIVEVAPAYDHADLTAITAAKLCREILLIMAAGA